MINISVTLSMGGLLGYITCSITSGRERIAYSLGPTLAIELNMLEYEHWAAMRLCFKLNGHESTTGWKWAVDGTLTP